MARRFPATRIEVGHTTANRPDSSHERPPLQDSPVNTLLAFEAAARHGSITRAAEERGTSHSAVSRHIRALERTLEVTLFERRGRGRRSHKGWRNPPDLHPVGTGKAA